MLQLGLSTADKKSLMTSLISTGRVHVKIEVMNLDQEVIGDLTDHLVDGQIDVDGSQQVTRQLTMTLLDVGRHLPFDTDAPAKTALFMDRMIQVRYGVMLNGNMFHFPVFTGPVTALKRNGIQITLTAQGKESLAMGNVWPPYTIDRNTKLTSAIHKLMIAAGEVDARMEIPDLPKRLAHHLSLHRADTYWAKALHLAHDLNRHLYYDAAGNLHLRNWPGHHATFTDRKNVIGDPEISYSQARGNSVMIIGGKPKGQKHPVIGFAVAPRSHPLSPWRLGRNNTARHILVTGQPITRAHVKQQSEVDDIAQTRLDHALLQQVQATFEAMPGAVALLDPHDLCHLNTADMVVPFRVGQFSLPLRDGGTASVGYHKNVSVRKGRRSHHHKSRKSGHRN